MDALLSCLIVFGIIFAILAPTSIALQCYDCDPTDSTCVTPKGNNAPETVCDPDHSVRRNDTFKNDLNNVVRTELESRNSTNLIYECFSIYSDSDSDEGKGVYRGCLLRDEREVNSCNFLNEQMVNRTIKDCYTCPESFCNIHDVGGGAVDIKATLSFVLFMIGALILKEL